MPRRIVLSMHERQVGKDPWIFIVLRHEHAEVSLLRYKLVSSLHCSSELFSFFHSAGVGFVIGRVRKRYWRLQLRIAVVLIGANVLLFRFDSRNLGEENRWAADEGILCKKYAGSWLHVATRLLRQTMYIRQAESALWDCLRSSFLSAGLFILSRRCL